MQKDTDAAVIERDTLPQGAAKAGAELRGVRERLGWQLADIAAELRIRLPYLEAIEAGDLAALPGAAYQTGFVRSYAQALGLDPDEILRRFRAEGMGIPKKAELSFLAPVPDRAVPTGAIVLLGVVALLVGYALWYHHTEHERELAAAIPSVPAELAPLAVPKPASPPSATKSAVAAAPPTVPVPAPAAIPGAVASLPPVTTQPVAAQPAVTQPALTPPMVPTQVASAGQAGATASAPTAATPAPSVTAPPAAPPPGSGQAILATADSWVEVADPTGNILFSRVLHAGESWPVPAIAGLTMTTGNAGGTEITDSGKAGAPLGSTGTVLHNYALTPPGAAPATAQPAATPAAQAAPPAPKT